MSVRGAEARENSRSSPEPRRGGTLARPDGGEVVRDGVPVDASGARELVRLVVELRLLESLACTRPALNAQSPAPPAACPAPAPAPASVSKSVRVTGSALTDKKLSWVAWVAWASEFSDWDAAEDDSVGKTVGLGRYAGRGRAKISDSTCGGRLGRASGVGSAGAVVGVGGWGEIWGVARKGSEVDRACCEKGAGGVNT